MVKMDLYQFRHAMMEPDKRTKVDYWDSYYLDEDICKAKLLDWVQSYKNSNPQLLSNMDIGPGYGSARIVYYRSGKRYEEHLAYNSYDVYVDKEIFHDSSEL